MLQLLEAEPPGSCVCVCGKMPILWMYIDTFFQLSVPCLVRSVTQSVPYTHTQMVLAAPVFKIHSLAQLLKLKIKGGEGGLLNHSPQW